MVKSWTQLKQLRACNALFQQINYDTLPLYFSIDKTCNSVISKFSLSFFHYSSTFLKIQKYGDPLKKWWNRKYSCCPILQALLTAISHADTQTLTSLSITRTLNFNTSPSTQDTSALLFSAFSLSQLVNSSLTYFRSLILENSNGFFFFFK